MALRLSQEEFTRGVQTYSRDMYRAARALTPCDADAQDAVGQAVLLAWQSLDRLRDPEALRAWLVKISVNCARQLNRRSRREHLQSLRGEQRTMVFYEAPHKLAATLQDLLDRWKEQAGGSFPPAL